MTAPLTPYQWAICVALGLGEFIWGQIVCTIPSNVLPKFFSLGRGEVQPTSILVTGEYDIPEVRSGAGKELGSVTPMSQNGRPGQILWLLGLTRLQTQVNDFTNYCKNDICYDKRLGLWPFVIVYL